MRAAILHAAALLAAAAPAGAADPRERPPPQQPPQVVPAPKTAKERLGGKASDEQRVDDCKVPPGRRTRPRPTACPWEFGS
jgi:hypothetical protein